MRDFHSRPSRKKQSSGADNAEGDELGAVLGLSDGAELDFYDS